MLGNFRPNHRYINDFPSTLLPPAGQLGSAVGAVLHHVLYPLGGCHAGAGKALGRDLRGPLGWVYDPLWASGLSFGGSPGVCPVGLAFQLDNSVFSKRSLIACCRTMTAMRPLALFRSISGLHAYYMT